MDGFYTTVLSIASIILILLLTYVGILLYYAKSDEVYPPYQKPCPDYWEIDNNGKCIYPGYNNRNIGTLVASGDKDENAKKIRSDLKAPAVTPGVTTSNGNVPDTIDFNDSKWKTVYSKKNELCNKKHWASLYSIEWDGVRNTNQC